MHFWNKLQWNSYQNTQKALPENAFEKNRVQILMLIWRTTPLASLCQLSRVQIRMHLFNTSVCGSIDPGGNYLNVLSHLYTLNWTDDASTAHRITWWHFATLTWLTYINIVITIFTVYIHYKYKYNCLCLLIQIRICTRARTEINMY